MQPLRLLMRSDQQPPAVRYMSRHIGTYICLNIVSACHDWLDSTEVAFFFSRYTGVPYAILCASDQATGAFDSANSALIPFFCLHYFQIAAWLLARCRTKTRCLSFRCFKINLQHSIDREVSLLMRYFWYIGTYCTVKFQASM